MSCENELKDQLGDYLKGVLPDTKAALVREHLNQCPDCRSDLEQLRFLLPGLAKLAEEHIPAENLVDYQLQAKSALLSDSGDWKPQKIEEHLALCNRCRAELDKLTAFEKEFQGVSKKSVTEPSLEKTPLSVRVFLRSRKVWYAAVAAAALILFLLPNLPLRSQGQMIAVLPFEYIGPPEKEYYAEGIPNDITARLANVSALGVISPSSTMRYKNTTKNPRQIGAELGVNYLLTGVIRWDTTGKIAKLRVAPRLVRTGDQNQLWTEPLEFVWGELCGIPGVIARKVVAALNVEFLESERQAMEACPTGNIEAYEYYLRGRQYAEQVNKQTTAVTMYEKAIQLDPTFALAYAQITLASGWIYWFNNPAENQRLKMKESAERALELQPDLPEAHLAMGWYFYWAELNIELALQECVLAERGLPNNSQLFFTAGLVYRSDGNFDLALGYLKKATKLNPLSAQVGLQLAGTYNFLRNYKEAEREYDRAISLTPGYPNLYGSKALYLCLYGQGNTENARSVLTKAAGKVDSTYLTPVWAAVECFDGNYQKALAWLPDAKSFRFYAAVTSASNYFLMKAEIYHLMGQPRLALAYYDSARAALETKSEERERPLGAFLHQWLGIAYAGLGRKEEAVREGKNALELRPTSKDAFYGTELVEALAEIYVMVGEYDLAIDQLEYLLSIPSFVSVRYLRIDPTWAPLRSHPRFQKLVNERA